MALTDLSSTVRIQLDWDAIRSATGIADQSQIGRLIKSLALTFGTGADEINQIYAGGRSLAASTTEDLDLAGGITNVFGETITFATVKVVLIWLLDADSTSPDDEDFTGSAAASITVGNDAASPALWFGNINDTIQVKNGAFFLHATPGTGYTITAGTGDILQVTNNDGAVTANYLLVILGTT